MWKACSCVKAGTLSAESFAEAVWRHYASRPPLGELALQGRHLTVKQVFEILGNQTANGQPFGMTAIALGFLTKQQFAELLLLQDELSTSVKDILEAMDEEKSAAPTGDATVGRDDLPVEIA